MRQKQVQKLLKIVKDNYNEIADNFSVSRERKMWPRIIDWAEKVKPHNNVLDLGCGNGRLIEELPTNCSYLGVDNSEQLLEIAKNKYGQRNNVKFLNVDFLDLEKLHQGSFDYIFSVAVLHHIPGKKLRQQALRSIRAKLTDDGRAIISVWNLREWKKFKKPLRRAYFWNIFKGLDRGDLLFNWKGGQISQRYYYAFTPKSLAKEIKAAGFKIIDSSQGEGSLYIIIEK